MPRSPSPPLRYPLPPRQYRENSPPRFRERQPYQGPDERSWGDYNRQRRDFDRDRDEDRDYRRPHRERSPVKSIHANEEESGSPEEGQITSPVRGAARLPPRPRSPPLRRRSPSPPPFRRRSRSPPPFRRRSPSKPYRRRSPTPPPYRQRSPSPPTFRRRSPSRSRSRRHSPSPPPPPLRRRSPSPRGYRDRQWDHPGRSRSPHPTRPLPRSPSPSSISSRSRSSRFHSPEKRSRAPSSSPASRQTLLEPLKRESPLSKSLPTGPKAVAIPTGPRALTGTAALPFRPRPNTYVQPIIVKEELVSSPSVEIPNPYARVPAPPVSAGGGTPRLSWSERKSLISPSAPTGPSEISVNPYTMGRKTSETVVKSENSYASASVRQIQNPDPIVKVEQPYPLGRQNSDVPQRIQTPVKDERVEEEKPRFNEAEITQLKARELESRIMAELPTLEVSHFGAGWETQVCLFRPWYLTFRDRC